MRKAVIGFLVGIVAFSIYYRGSDVYNRFAGPTVEHRQDGILSYKGDDFHAIDPATKLVVNKDLASVGDPKVYLDVEPNGVQYAKWKSTNLSDFDVEFHLKPPTNEAEKESVKSIKSEKPNGGEIAMLVMILFLAAIGAISIVHFIMEEVLT